MRYKVGIVVSISVLLIGCGSDKILKEAQSTQAQNETVQEEIEQLHQDRIDLYQELERPIEEVLSEIELEERELIAKDEQLPVRQQYTDEEEFAQFVAEKLYRFYTLELSPEEFYKFNINYGSQEILEGMASDREGNIVVYSNIQSLFEELTTIKHGYDISTVGLNSNRREGYFYRLIYTNLGEEYYITTIVREDGIWKFSNDKTSPPFDIKDTIPDTETVKTTEVIINVKEEVE
ncbi:hypothetical protein [Bacillus alkalicellulosilyticus]|uniref:hypothetical protein n=1 Tax=Alkalihalobacterium alkalicellulosilyticum TaxID=1912214 RepID=UPI0009975607|nr:hypothetical protein [Bacillus alkalicellulosilyticus]